MLEKIQVLLGINKLLSKSITESQASGSGCRPCCWKCAAEKRSVFSRKKSKCSLLLKYFSLTATLDPRSHYVSLAAGSGPPTAPGDDDLPHKHAHPISCSILSALYLNPESVRFSLFPLLYNRWVEALCWIPSHSFIVASRPICAQYAGRGAAHTRDCSAHFTGSWQDSLQQQLENHK